MKPHSLVLSFIGACLLWVGWFGFNAGAALALTAAQAWRSRLHIALRPGALGWMVIEWMTGKPSVSACSGAVAGLVAITPASGCVIGAALLIGLPPAWSAISTVVVPSAGLDTTIRSTLSAFTPSVASSAHCSPAYSRRWPSVVSRAASSRS